MRPGSAKDESPAIHPATRLGHVHLAVADLDRLIAFYQNFLGFQTHWREGLAAGLGAGGEDLLRLTEERGGRRVRGTTGLYHFAVLLPDRRELARAIYRLISARYPNYPTDHVMTETTYLSDPEGNGIELYVDTPEDGTWDVVGDTFVARDAAGVQRSGREPLDVEALLRAYPPGRVEIPLREETTIGHVHLHVANLSEGIRFYHEVLRFDIKISSPGMGAAFVSAGGYHHHVGMNTWIGEGAPPSPPGALGLRYFTVVLPDRPELERLADRTAEAGIPVEQRLEGILLRDPAQNGVLLTAGPMVQNA